MLAQITIEVWHGTCIFGFWLVVMPAIGMLVAFARPGKGK